MNKLLTTRLVLLSLISSIASFGTHLYLAVQHFKLNYGLAEGQSLCNVSATFSCDTVALSVYSSLLGVPMAVWGLATHLVFSSLLIVQLLGWNSDPNRTLRLNWLTSLFIFGTSIVMGSISLFVIKSYCLFCIAAYILSLIIFVSLSIAQEKGFTKELPSDSRSLFSETKWYSLTLLSIILIGFLANTIISDSLMQGRIKEIASDSTADWTQAPIQTFDTSTGLIKASKDSNRLTIVEFIDFLCPHCKMASPSLHAFQQSRNDVTLIVKFFPLDGTCNNGITQKGDGLRCRLAYAAHCAEQISKKGFVLQHLIFTKQSDWSTANLEQLLKELAQQADLNFDQLSSCMAKDETHQAILSQSAEGLNAQIRGTPSIFANGKLLRNGQIIEVMQRVYKSL